MAERIDDTTKARDTKSHDGIMIQTLYEFLMLVITRLSGFSASE